MRASLPASLLLFLLTACAGGGSSAPTPAGPQDAAASLGSANRSTLGNSGYSYASTTVSGANDRLYVGNTGNNSITVYWHAASGNTAPLFVIAGTKTGLSSPGSLAEDAQGNLYVANRFFQVSSANASILVFAHGASGNVAPIRKIAGSRTGLNGVAAITVDKATGQLFVFNSVPSQTYSILERFAQNATGNVAPVASVTGMLYPTQIALDSTDKNIIEAHLPFFPNGGAGFGTVTFLKQFTNGVVPSNLYVTNWFFANGLANDPTTKTYLATTSQGIYRLAEDTTGSGPADPLTGQTLTPAPVSVITSDVCGSQLAVAPGPTPYTYVMHSTLSRNGSRSCSVNAVYVYTNNANKNATPLRVLSGLATKMDLPYGITEGP